MGEVGRLLVTGASGFVGRAVVAEAVSRGWYVTGLVRKGEAPGAQITVECDLAKNGSKSKLAEILPRVDAVIHCAASLSGDQVAHARDTDLATQQLLQALSVTPKRLVHVSSIAVLAANGLSDGAMIDESTPIETEAKGRDAYARAKLSQEWQVRDVARDTGLPVWIMRPGAIFGPERLWNAHIGPTFGPTLIRMEKRGDVPLSFIDHCAEALVRAAETEPREPVSVVHVVDDDLPDRGTFLKAMQCTGWPGRVIPFNWRLVKPAAAILGQSGHASAMLNKATLHARFQPLRFANKRLHTWLGWEPRMDFDDAFGESLRREGP